MWCFCTPIGGPEGPLRAPSWTAPEQVEQRITSYCAYPSYYSYPLGGGWLDGPPSLPQPLQIGALKWVIMGLTTILHFMHPKCTLSGHPGTPPEQVLSRWSRDISRYVTPLPTIVYLLGGGWWTRTSPGSDPLR